MTVDLFVNGTLMRGLALHKNLDGAEFIGAFRTAPVYRLYSIGDVHPGMFEVETGGVSVAGEIYRMSEEILERVESGEPPTSTAAPSNSRTAAPSTAFYFRVTSPKATTRIFRNSATGAPTWPRQGTARSGNLNRRLRITARPPQTPWCGWFGRSLTLRRSTGRREGPEPFG